MLPTLQPNRPKLIENQDATGQTQTSPRNPRFQQQIRHANQAQYMISPVVNPKNQIEAMPPISTPKSVSAKAPELALPSYNPAILHPVFFANSWRKPPFPLPLSTGFSPVATGYVFGDTRARANSTTKL